MISIAIVEDNKQDRETLVSYIARYENENGCSFKTTQFNNAITFLTNYNPIFDIILIDIQMPHMDGMEAAEKLRMVDDSVPLVFITNMSNYAIKGYSVNAADFVVKPVSYYNFAAMLGKVLRLAERRSTELILKTPEGGRRILVQDIIFVEVIDHKVIYHTEKEDIEIWESLKSQEKKLISNGFARCNNYCIVNLKYVDRVTGNSLTVKGQEIMITRTKKKEFMERLVEYYGNNI